MITISDKLMPGTPDTPIDARAVVDTEADIMDIQLPYVGLIVYCKETGKHYKILSLGPRRIGNFDLENAGVGTYIEMDTEPKVWYVANN